VPEDRSQAAVEPFIDQIRSAREASRTARAEVRVVDSPEARLALGVWRRADDLVDGVLALAAEELAEPIGVLARTLWEGAVTIEYVRGNLEVRQRQLLITALVARRALRNEPWVREVRDEIDKDLASREEELIEAAKRAEEEYKAERNAATERGEEVGSFDHDRAAELPSVQARARAVGADGQYLVYRFESAGVHWQASSLLHLFSEGGEHLAVEERPEWRFKQVVVLAMTTYRLLVSHCMELLGLQPPQELTGEGVAIGEDEITEERS
jgi:hypothetical protein